MNKAVTIRSPEPSTQRRSWSARLDLRFEESDSKTRLAHCEHQGPLRVQRLFYPQQNGKAHCYLLHPPGGVVVGDELHIRVAQDSGDALITTPSAGRFYRVDAHPEPQRQQVDLQINAGRFEWLPQETLIFTGANAQLQTRIDIGAGADLVFWDVIVLGRPACDEPFQRGQVTQTLAVDQNTRPLLRERLELRAGDRLSGSMMGLNDCSTLGVMLATRQPERALCDDWLQAVNGATDGAFVITQRKQLLIARYRGDDALQCRLGFAALWTRLNEDRDGVAPATPRIWHT